MKVTYNWLKDFVDIRLRPEALADRLTMSGLEVISLEKFEDDHVFEIEITSNRPDWLSVVGIAREVAAITGKKMRDEGRGIWGMGPGRRGTGKRESGLRINIEDKKACPFYSARTIYDVKVGPSPECIAGRLRAIGLRPVNNIVDITNYILFTTGQPLHAFDLDRIEGKTVAVRFARENEELTTIDGIRRKLSSQVLVIADEKKPIAIAGIMGGKETEVSGSTRNVLLEGASFSPLAIRRASRLLGLSSDASYRFERSVDIHRVIPNSDMAVSFILENAGSHAGRIYSSGLRLKKTENTVSFSVSKANRLIGTSLPLSKIRAILSALGFKVSAGKGDILKAAVPGFRQDVTSPADIIEELCRIYGYENIPFSLAAIKPSSVEEDTALIVQAAARGLLTTLGFNEIIAYSLISRESLNKIKSDPQAAVCLESPLSAQQEVLRPGLMAGLLSALGRNIELGNSRCAFFEIGNCFKEGAEFRAVGLISDKYGFLELKGRLELLLQRVGIRDYRFSPVSGPAFAEGLLAALTIGSQETAWVGQLKQEVLEGFKIEAREVTFAEINLDKLQAGGGFPKIYRPLPRYPSVLRSLSLVLDEGLPYQKILDTIRGCNIEYLEDIRFQDVYSSETLGKGKKSVTVSLEFRSPKATLTDSEANSCLDEIIRAAAKELGAGIR